MLSLRETAAMERAANTYPNLQLRHLLDRRIKQLRRDCECDLNQIVHFLVIEPGDTLPDAEAELGFPLLVNLIDGARFGEDGFTPSWEWIESHGFWFELAFILSDDGFGAVVFVPDSPDAPEELLRLCRTFAFASA